MYIIAYAFYENLKIKKQNCIIHIETNIFKTK